MHLMGNNGLKVLRHHLCRFLRRLENFDIKPQSTSRGILRAAGI
jgi:hypothetical protein